MKKTLIVLISIALLSCKNEAPLTGTYTGFWASSWWTLELQPNNEFKFKSAGHFGTTETVGTFTIEDQLLKLVPVDDSTIQLVLERYQFKILGDSCLVDTNLGYDYCKNEPDRLCSRKWDLEQTVIIEDCW